MVHYELECQFYHEWHIMKDDSGKPAQYTDAKIAFDAKAALEGHGDAARVIQVRCLSDNAFEHRTVIDDLSMVIVK